MYLVNVVYYADKPLRRADLSSRGVLSSVFPFLLIDVHIKAYDNVILCIISCMCES